MTKDYSFVDDTTEKGYDQTQAVLSNSLTGVMEAIQNATFNQASDTAAVRQSLKQMHQNILASLANSRAQAIEALNEAHNAVEAIILTCVEQCDQNIKAAADNRYNDAVRLIGKEFTRPDS